MPQIKFRGFVTDTLMRGETWVYGSNLAIDYDKKTAYLDNKEVVFDTVGQFIGDYDKNNNEIYEGDLLDIQNGSTEEYKHFLAQIHRHGPSFDVSEPIYINSIIRQPVPHFINQTGMILGNIHEHKDQIQIWQEKIKKENVHRI